MDAQGPLSAPLEGAAPRPASPVKGALKGVARGLARLAILPVLASYRVRRAFLGDQAFRERCLARLRQYHARGGTLILVSHELEQLRELCTRGVWLDQGRILMDAPIDMVLERYRGQE